MKLFAIFYGFYETASEDCTLVTVYTDRQAAIDWVIQDVEDEGTPGYGLYVVEFEPGQSPHSGTVVHEIEGEF